MKIVFVIASLKSEDIFVKGDYGSDYKPIEEHRTVIEKFHEFDDEETAIKQLPNYTGYGRELTIIKVYK